MERRVLSILTLGFRWTVGGVGWTGLVLLDARCATEYIEQYCKSILSLETKKASLFKWSFSCFTDTHWIKNRKHFQGK
jgi:hypothetical protein